MILKKIPCCVQHVVMEFSLEVLLGNKSRTMEADKPDAQNKENDIIDENAEIVLEDDEDIVIEDDLLENDGLLEDDDEENG